jgi:hypothetical protein
MRGSGGTQGGVSQFGIGFLLAAVATYIFFWSVNVTTRGTGAISGAVGRGMGGHWETTSMAILFVPLFVGVIALFYDARMKWAWWLAYLGIAVLAIEIFSRIRFDFSIKLVHLIGMIVMFCAGVGLMLRSYRDQGKGAGKKEPDSDGDKPLGF